MSTGTNRPDGLSGYFAAADQPREGLIARFKIGRAHV